MIRYVVSFLIIDYAECETSCFFLEVDLKFE